MCALFSYYKGEYEQFIKDALGSNNDLIKILISEVRDKLINDLEQLGIKINGEYRHTIDNNAIKHSIKKHSKMKESLRGQVPITLDDLSHLPEIIDTYDSLSTSKNRRNQDVIIYEKKFIGCTSIYVEEMRLGRLELAACTIYKRKNDGSPTLID